MSRIADEFIEKQQKQAQKDCCNFRIENSKPPVNNICCSDCPVNNFGIDEDYEAMMADR